MAKKEHCYFIAQGKKVTLVISPSQAILTSPLVDYKLKNSKIDILKQLERT